MCFRISSLPRICICKIFILMFCIFQVKFCQCNCCMFRKSDLSTVTNQTQGSHRLEKYLNLGGFLKKSLKIKSALKSTGKSFKSLEILEFYYFLLDLAQLIET